MRIKRGSIVAAMPQPEKRISENVFHVDTAKQIKRGSVLSTKDLIPQAEKAEPSKQNTAVAGFCLAIVVAVLAIGSMASSDRILPLLKKIGWGLLGLVGVAVVVIGCLVALILYSSLVTIPSVKEPWVGAGDFLSNFEWDKKRPLRICFITWGSRGDHQPMVALGVELAKKGHEVTVMSLERYKGLVEAHPELTCREYVDSHIWQAAATLNEPGNEDQFPFICSKFVGDSMEELSSQYIKAAQETNADVLVGQYIPLCILQQFTAAQAVKKPLFLLLHDPFNAPPNTEYSFDPSTNRCQDHGFIANILNGRVMSLLIGALNTLSLSSKVRKYRQSVGLKTRWPMMEVLGPRDVASMPAFTTWDASLWPPVKKAPRHWHSTGFFLTQGGGKFHDQDVCMKWLEGRQKQGRKVIYAALGSFDHHDKDLFTDLLIEAAKELNVDVITLKTAVSAGNLPNTIFVANEVPQTLVFPKMLAIVHHGGAGTASQVIRSGRPGVCLPAMHFQETWGARLQDYKGAGILVTQAEMEEAYLTTGENLLLQAIQKALDPEVQKKAAEMGEAARNAPGVKYAADTMIEYLKAL